MIITSRGCSVPEHVEKGLFVAHLDIAPNEEVQQHAMAPEGSQIERSPARAGSDDDCQEWTSDITSAHAVTQF